MRGLLPPDVRIVRTRLTIVLVFPGLFRGALDVCASDITPEMEMAAVYALADIVKDEELDENYIIPGPLDKKVVKAIAKAVSNEAIRNGVARSFY